MTHHIEVEDMEGMSRKQVRITNNVANTLIGDHAMCMDCAIAVAVSFVWSRSGETNKPKRAYLCSAVCGDAIREFAERYFQFEGKIPLEQLPSKAN